MEHGTREPQTNQDTTPTADGAQSTGPALTPGRMLANPRRVRRA